MVAELDYVEVVRQESSKFAACMATADRAARVPSCPDWTADDLLWHLTEVQFFWAVIVRDRLGDPEAADAAVPPRPDEHRPLLALFGEATDALVDALSSAPPETAVWTWANDHSVAFVSHWQAHEALIHRLDAEGTVGTPTPIGRDLAADGIDLVLNVRHGDLPAWATFTPDGSTGAIEATDASQTWRFALGRFRGTGPESGTKYDMESLVVDATITDPPAFTVRGNAADVDTWLWGRTTSEGLDIDGDRDAFARFEEIVTRGID